MKIINKKYYFIVAIIFVITVVLGLNIFTEDESVYIPYTEFVRNIELEIVESVEITENKINIKNKNDEVIYCTDNPETPDFKEYLLLNGIKIENIFGTGDVVYIMDVLFYILFFGSIGFAVYKVISYTNKNFKIVRDNHAKFSDIIGMENVKTDMIKTIDILKRPQVYAEKGIRAPKGIILEGPPGNGKTLFAKALAGEAKVNFIATKGADFQSVMMSVGSRKIKSLFKKAKNNKPCIIFIDEFDGIGERRNYAGTGVDKENNRIITAMLNEMDGFDDLEGVLVIAATNSYASLDSALVRPGRFDRKYKIDNPKSEDIVALIDMYTKNKKVASSVNKQLLAKCFEGLSCAAIETIINEAATETEINDKEEITIEDIVSAGKKTNIVNIKIK